MSSDDDDKPTVVLDLNALKMQKLKQEEELATMVEGLEFAVPASDSLEQSPALTPKAEPSLNKAPTPKPALSADQKFTIILFDFESDFFSKAKPQFPQGYNYVIAKTLADLNKHLASKSFQICVFNYDVNPKAVNTLTAQIKQKFPFTKTMIMAKAISPEKAKIHAKTPSGAHGYYQFPLVASKIESEFQKIQQSIKKVG